MDLFRERRHLRSSWWRFSHLCTCFSGLLRASAGLRSCGFCRGFVIALDAGRSLVCIASAREEVVPITLPTKSLCSTNAFAFGSHLIRLRFHGKLQSLSQNCCRSVTNENKMFSRMFENKKNRKGTVCTNKKTCLRKCALTKIHMVIFLKRKKHSKKTKT